MKTREYTGNALAFDPESYRVERMPFHPSFTKRIMFANDEQKSFLMRCDRCDGMMIFEKYYADCEYFFGWRCINCGEIVDRVILENRNSYHR